MSASEYAPRAFAGCRGTSPPLCGEVRDWSVPPAEILQHLERPAGIDHRARVPGRAARDARIQGPAPHFADDVDVLRGIAARTHRQSTSNRFVGSISSSTTTTNRPR